MSRDFILVMTTKKSAPGAWVTGSARIKRRLFQHSRGVLLDRATRLAGFQALRRRTPMVSLG